jgi:hypothetical protein
MVRLRSKLNEVALREEVREEFDVLDKSGVPLPKQPARSTARPRTASMSSMSVRALAALRSGRYAGELSSGRPLPIGKACQRHRATRHE